MIRVVHSVTILCPIDEVFAFWHDLENLPRFMQHLQFVETNGRSSHWVARAPAGQTVEWDAEIITDEPNRTLSWRSLDDASVRNAGSVQFREAPGDRGTEVRVELSYDAPAGAVGVTVAKLLGEEPDAQVRDDLRRFKQVMETGEVVKSDGSPEGAGQGALEQRAAQPAGEEKQGRRKPGPSDESTREVRP